MMKYTGAGDESILHQGRPDLQDHLQSLGEMPDDWRKANVTPTLKKGKE